MHTRVGRRGAGVIAATLLIMVVACAINPVTGKRQVTLVSESQEIAMGAAADPQIVAEYGLYDDPQVAAYVDAVGQKLARQSHRPNLDYKFRVLDSPVINAFALPGGYIYITRGILAHMNNEAELAIVLGHEIGHVTARHGVEQQTRQALFGAGLQLGAVLSPQVARFGQAIEQGLGLLFLKYGRDDENQADELGVEYSLRAGYDAKTGARFFEVLDRQTQESGQSLPTWMSTHPAPADRVKHTHDLAVAREPQHPEAVRVAASELKARVDGVVFGEDPRQGFLDGNLFKHPALGVQIEMPPGWQVANLPASVQAVEPRKQAMVQLTLEQSGGLRPAEYAARVVESANAAVDRAGAERIDGAEAYLAVLRFAAQDGSVTLAQAGFVQRASGGPIFQIVGYAAPEGFASYRDVFLGTIRSLRGLHDPAALGIQPNRVRLEPVRATTTLAQACERAGSLPVPLATVALLNNLRPASSLAPGFQLKLVRGNYRPTAARGGS